MALKNAAESSVSLKENMMAVDLSIRFPMWYTFIPSAMQLQNIEQRNFDEQNSRMSS
ncbi:hypothetical protein GCM10009069_05600 [Algimonas arctica]|uniref:Uncharacterized protein n=1 Tax=Algimonas arctica TaxID=1479486 RepID=A0A8J3CM31_9PROT|nr:hypothetical protein GCM10009069_05600 [Algimonas arctica]